jgi:K+-transporting ATPase A subunit
LRAVGDYPRISRRTNGRKLFVDMWRVVVYIYLPAALIIGVIFMHEGMPMTYASQQTVTTLERGAMGTGDHAADQRRKIAELMEVLSRSSIFINVDQRINN